MALRIAGIKEESAKHFCTAFFKVNKAWILFLENRSTGIYGNPCTV